MCYASNPTDGFTAAFRNDFSILSRIRGSNGGPNAKPAVKPFFFSSTMKHSIEDRGDLRKYFAAIPRIVFRMGLNPFEFTLYAYLKDTAGESGSCWKSRATIAKESGMSSGMVTKARLALETPRAVLGGAPLITVTEQPTKGGGKPTCHIQITDIWAANILSNTTSYGDVATSLHDRQRHHTTIATSPHDHKEKEEKKNKEQDIKRDFLTVLKTDPLYSHINFEHEIEKMRRWLALPQNQGRRLTERFLVNWLNKIDRPVDLFSEPEPVTRTEKVGDRLKRESCQRCWGTCTEVIPGKGARFCDHEPRTIDTNSDTVGHTQEDRQTRIS